MKRPRSISREEPEPMLGSCSRSTELEHPGPGIGEDLQIDFEENWVQVTLRAQGDRWGVTMRFVTDEMRKILWDAFMLEAPHPVAVPARKKRAK